MIEGQLNIYNRHTVIENLEKGSDPDLPIYLIILIIRDLVESAEMFFCFMS